MFQSERIYLRRSLLGLILGATLAPVPSGLSASDLPTLDELKASGARQSRYRNRQAHAVASESPELSPDQFRQKIMPILTKHCAPCHGPEKAKADLRIDKLNPDLLKGGDVDWWLEVVAVLGNGEMPPPKKSKLSGEERTRAIELLSKEIRVASIVRRATGGHSSFRRMTRYEYNYALQDLLGLHRDFARDLPPEAHSEDGFQNSSETLQMSVMQLETYRRLARRALSRATVLGPRPPILHWGVSMKQRAEIEWAKQRAEIKKLEDKFKEDPEKQTREVDRLLASYRKPHSKTSADEARQEFLARAANLREDEGSLHAAPVRSGRGARRDVSYMASLLVSREQSGPVVLAKGNKFRVRGRVRSPAGVTIGFSALDADRASGGRYLTRKRLEGEFDIELPLDAFQLLGDRSGATSPLGRELIHWWCSTDSREAVLEITSVRLLEPE